ncbi:MAG: site-2 protease family protein, partial [Leptolyngbyaceae cyanobacterium MO_188.B28]|nr:site-2 protease family protein [Leptolyngbyaceae cyanobacterium MO_188.B28]
MHFFWLLLLGIFTYYVVQRSVASITRTPIWLLWLVMMTPAFILTAWSFTQGQAQQLPPRLLLSLFLSCLLMYWFLIQWGRLPLAKTTLPEKGAPPVAVQLNPESKSTLRPIDKEEESNLQQCFPWSVFYLQNIEYRPQAMICRGQLRTSSGVAYRTIKENIEAQFGDRFLIIFQEGFNGKPFFALVPNPQAKENKTKEKALRNDALTRPGLALALLFT